MATEVTAHVTGLVARIEASVGDALDAGDVVMVLESMKMEMPVEAECAGTVAAITVNEGDSVLEGDVLATLK